MCLQELFCCQSLRSLNISDNDLVALPPMIGSLVNLERLDISKNGALCAVFSVVGGVLNAS